MSRIPTRARRVGAAAWRLLRSPYAWGLATGVALLATVRLGDTVTSTDGFCGSCHVHPHATASWKQSTHHVTASGVVVHCVECHLPPGGAAYAREKVRASVRDLYGLAFRTQDSVHWAERSQLEHAVAHVFEASCLACHENLFPLGLSEKGREAHLHWERHAAEVRCISCHLHVGHFDPLADAADFGLVSTAPAVVYDARTPVEGFVDYTERIPGTGVDFDMVAVPGGTFAMGSPDAEPYRREDEGPRRTVRVSPFWMGRVEVTWDEFEAWYAATRSEGRSDTRVREEAGVDAITGATPPYVPPDQGWGKGKRPAITMTHHAAEQYTRWLSAVTGRRYRLPTEAEWEYAARGGTDGPYFFDADPRSLAARRPWDRLLGRDTGVLDRYAIHAGNSRGRTATPAGVEPNPFGLVNMVGNVREFTADWYQPDAYRDRGDAGEVVDPRGPATGTERVVRGGSFRSGPAELRSAARDRTRSDACFLTDPQVPKSRWWYSDCADIGFRVVRELDGEERGGMP